MAQSINLQITPSGVTPTIYASQFDVGREITFNLYDGPTAYIPPAGSTIRFEGKKSDGNGFSYDCNYTDNIVTVVLTDQMTVFAENVTCELRIADTDDNDIGTLNVILSVEKSPIDGDTSISDTEIPAIVELARAEQYNAEAWAEGTRNGVPVGPTDPTYENNAKYYAEHSSASIANLSDTDIQNLTDGQILKYDSNSGKWVNDDETGGASSLDDLTNVNITTPTNNQVLKYDSVNDEWVNGDAPSGGSGGSTVTVTTSEASLYGQAVTITDGHDTYTGTFSNTGLCEIQGVEITGTATVSSGAASASITMPYFGNYSVVLSLFSATVTVTFPYSNGATCTLSDGVTTLTATSSPMAFTVPNVGTWTATVTLDGQSKTDSAQITTDGQTASLTIEYGTINLTFDDDFRSQTITCESGGTTITKPAPSVGNTMVFYPPTTGVWDITGYVGGVPYSTSATIVSLSTSVSAILQMNVTLTVTLYSATEDTVTFTDESGAKTEVFASGQSSKSISITIPPSGMSITFTSSIAKNPDDLSQYYSKTVTVNSGTTEVYVMPNVALYWYGYINGIEDMITANGWTWSGVSMAASTFNTNNIVILNGGIGTNDKVTGTVKVILQGVTDLNNVYGATATVPSKTFSNADRQDNTEITSTSLHVISTNISNRYLTAVAVNGRSMKLMALWLE